MRRLRVMKLYCRLHLFLQCTKALRKCQYNISIINVEKITGLLYNFLFKVKLNTKEILNSITM